MEDTDREKPESGTNVDKKRPEKELPSVCSRVYTLEQVFSHKLRTSTLEDLLLKLVLDRDGELLHLFMGYRITTHTDLVLHFTNLDTDFSHAFLVCHHIYCPSEKLLESLIDL